MKIQIASDLHLDLRPRLDGTPPTIIERTDADVVVLAGDIHDGYEGIERFQSWTSHADVIYLAGTLGQGRQETLNKTLDKVRRLVTQTGSRKVVASHAKRSSRFSGTQH